MVRANDVAQAVAAAAATFMIIQLLVSSQTETCLPCPTVPSKTAFTQELSVASMEALFEASDIAITKDIFLYLNWRYSSGSILFIGADLIDTTDRAFWKWLKSDKTFQKIFVEPIPEVFKQLEKKVAMAKMKSTVLANAAISEIACDGTSACHTMTGTAKTKDGDGGDSIDEKRAPNQRLRANIDDRAVDSGLQTLAFSALLEKYDVKAIRALQIGDASCVARVLRQLPLNHHTFRPEVIFYKDAQLSRPQQEMIRRKLHHYGYILKSCKQHVEAYRALD